MTINKDNPFRIHGTVRKEFFTDRKIELVKFERVLREPAAKMLVYGQRRMGKTSTLENAVDTVNAKGGHAFLADLSTVTTVTDMANRVLTSAAKTVGRRWASFISDLVSRLQTAVKVSPDPATGLMLPSLEIGVRQENLETQQASLAKVMDSLDAIAAGRGVTLGVVLDEFQEISRLGGDQAEWHLRGVMQHHQHLSYIAAGSKPALLKAMVGHGRAFYEMLDLHAFGPIDRTHMARWIDDRIQSVHLTPIDAGQACVAIAGARSRDVVRLARKCVDRAQDGASVGLIEVAAAYREIIDEDGDAVQGWWGNLTAAQQNVVRGVAASDHGMTTRDMRERFSLEGSGSVSNTLKALIEDGRLMKTTYGSGYTFDNPFVRGWVIVHALPDIGVRLDPTYIASQTGEYD